MLIVEYVNRSRTLHDLRTLRNIFACLFSHYFFVSKRTIVISRAHFEILYIIHMYFHLFIVFLLSSFHFMPCHGRLSLSLSLISL